MASDIQFSKFRIGEGLAQRVVAFQRPRETMTSAVIRAIRDGVDAPVRDELVRLKVASAMTAINAGRSDVAFEHLRSIMQPAPTAHSEH